MFNFKICRGAGRTDADASRDTILLMFLTGNKLNSYGVCVAVDKDDTEHYEVGELVGNLSMQDDRWIELDRAEAWKYREEIGRAVLYHTTG